MLQQTCAFFFCFKCINLTGLAELFLQDEPALCGKCFPHFERNINAVFPATCFVEVYVSEWVYTRVNDNFLQFQRFEVQGVLKKPGGQFVDTSAVITIVLFSVCLRAVPFSLLPLSPFSPLSLLIHGLSAVLKSMNRNSGDKVKEVIFLV